MTPTLTPTPPACDVILPFFLLNHVLLKILKSGSLTNLDTCVISFLIEIINEKKLEQSVVLSLTSFKDVILVIASWWNNISVYKSTKDSEDTLRQQCVMQLNSKCIYE